MVNVVVGRRRDIRVSANATSGIIDTTVPVTIKNTPTLSSMESTQRLDSLLDVISSGETNGAVPVYDSSIDKYVVQKLNLTDVDGGLDGGTF
jgi:hypothetical protein